jgi:hypothetical protein
MCGSITLIDDKEIASDDMKFIPLTQDRHCVREIVLSEFY